MPTLKKYRAPPFRVRLAQAIESAEQSMRPDERRPAAYALAYLAGYMGRDAPEFAAGLQRLLKRDADAPPV